MSEVTKEDLIESRTLILDVVTRGFAGIHARQDVTNGRVATVESELGKLEVDLGRQDERIKNIGHEVFNRRADDRRRKAVVPDEAKPVTRRDVVIVMGTVAIVVSVVKFLAWVAPAAAVLTP